MKRIFYGERSRSFHGREVVDITGAFLLFLKCLPRLTSGLILSSMLEVLSDNCLLEVLALAKIV